MRIILLLVLSTFTFLANAQKIELAKDGTVSQDGKDLFVIIGKQGVAKTNFIIKTLAGEEVMSADAVNGSNMLNIVVKNSPATLSYPLTINTKKVLAKELANYGVIEANDISDLGLKRFVTARGGSIGGLVIDNAQTLIVPAAPDYQLVRRDMEAPIFVFGKEIKQDNKLIATYTLKNETHNGKVYQVYVFHNPAGNILLADSYGEMMGEKTLLRTYAPNWDSKTTEVELPKNGTPQLDVTAIVNVLIAQGVM